MLESRRGSVMRKVAIDIENRKVKMRMCKKSLSSTLSILQPGIARTGFARLAVVRVFGCLTEMTTLKKSISLTVRHLPGRVLRAPEMDKVELRARFKTWSSPPRREVRKGKTGHSLRTLRFGGEF
jgi:hypothetical protein